MTLNTKSTNTNWDIFSGSAWFYLASDSTFLEVRVKVFYNVAVKRDSSVRFTRWQSLLSLLWCCTVLNQSSFTLTVLRYIVILSLLSIAFRFHLIKPGRLGKNGHREKVQMVGKKREWDSCGPAISFTKGTHQLMKYCLQGSIIFGVNLTKEWPQIYSLSPWRKIKTIGQVTLKVKAGSSVLHSLMKCSETPWDTSCSLKNFVKWLRGFIGRD